MSLKSIFIDILLTFSFLSRLPIKLPQSLDWQNRIKRIPRFFTLVGYLAGFVYYLGTIVTQSISHIFAFIFLAIGFYFFDLFHFDGLLDTLDGFLNQTDTNRRLEIMSKGNVGAFAVFYGVLLVITLVEFMNIVEPQDFLIAAVLARLSMNIILIISKPAKPTGLGAMLYPTQKVDFFLSLVWSMPLLFIYPYKYIVSLITVILVSFIMASLSKKLINGITGDVLGGSCLVSLVFILAAVHLGKNMTIITS